MELTRYSYFRITTMGKKDLSINQKSDIVKQGRLKTELARAFSCTRHLENVSSCTTLKLCKPVYFTHKVLVSWFE